LAFYVRGITVDVYDLLHDIHGIPSISSRRYY